MRLSVEPPPPAVDEFGVCPRTGVMVVLLTMMGGEGTTSKTDSVSISFAENLFRGVPGVRLVVTTVDGLGGRNSMIVKSKEARRRPARRFFLVVVLVVVLGVPALLVLPPLFVLFSTAFFFFGVEGAELT